jgi:hypothetical protein
VWGEERKYVVSPVIPQWLSSLLTELAYQASMGPGDAARHLLLRANQDIDVLDKLAPYFWRDYQCRGRTWLGSSDCLNLNELLMAERAFVEPLSISLTRNEWFLVDNVAYALCRSIHQTAAALLILAVHCDGLMTQYMAAFRDSSKGVPNVHGEHTLSPSLQQFVK